MKAPKASQTIMQQRSFPLSGPDSDQMNQRLVQSCKVRRMSLARFIAIVLSAAAVTQIPGTLLSKNTALAQQSFGQTPDSFPIPESLPDGTTLKLDGSTSMRLTNEAIEQRFEDQYANIDVELDASRTDQAFESLVKGDIDILATGRPLTAEEKAQGIVEVPLEQREKLAIILGPDNPLPTEDDPATPEIEGNLTFEQFARMFRGEITNWSEVGGPDLPIRFVDRPEYSDTRRALSTYTVFDGKPFATGSTVDPVEMDETDAVINALGNDGIGYSVVSQVADRDDVRIISMHQTLPDDPRYPYSQYRAFAFKEGAGPAALAFLGFATSEPGQEVIGGAAAVPGNLPDAAPNTTPPVVDPEPAASPAAAGKGKFPWWWLLLLGLIPLLWLALRGKKSAVGAAAAPVAAPVPVPPLPARMVLTPRTSRDGYAYWEVPQERINAAKQQGGKAMKLRMYDVTGRLPDTPLPDPVLQVACNEADPDRHVPIQHANRDYRAQVGYLTENNRWLPLATSNAIRVPETPKVANVKDTGSIPWGAAAGAGAIAAGVGLGAVNRANSAQPVKPKVNLKAPVKPVSIELRSPEEFQVKWTMPRDQKMALLNDDAYTPLVKLQDVTGVDLAKQPARSVTTHPVTIRAFDGNTASMVLPVPRCDRDYRAELGYQHNNSWVSLGQSRQTHVTCPVNVKAPVNPVLIGVRSPEQFQVRWAMPEDQKLALLNDDAYTPLVKLQDVTGIDLGQQPAHSVTTHSVTARDFDGNTASMLLPVPRCDRDYLAELGYQHNNSWVSLGQSRHTHVQCPVNVKAPVESIAIGVRSPEQFQVRWTMAEDQKMALLNDEAYGPEVKILDVTGIDLAHQPAHSVTTHPITAQAFAGNTATLLLPVPQCDRDYLAELGYTHNNSWVSLGQSRHTHVKCPVNVKAPVESMAIGVRSPEEFQVRWTMPEDQKLALLNDDAYTPQVKIYDVTGIDWAKQPSHGVTAHPITGNDFDGNTAAMVLPVPRCDRDYLAELGYGDSQGKWVSLGRSRHTHVKCPVNVKAPVESMAIGVRSPEEFQVRWTMPEDQKLALLNDDAYTPLVKIQDVTGIDLAQQPAHSVTTHPVTAGDFDGNTASLVLPVPQCDRDYLAELGYNHDNSWVSLGQSRHTHVKCPVNVKAPVKPVLIGVRSPEEFQVRWAMPEDQKLALLNDDAYTPLVKIQDVTGIDLAKHPAHSVTTHPVTARVFNGNTASMLLPVPQCDRDYLAELGYNHNNIWVSLGRSRHTHVQCPVNVKAPVKPVLIEVRSPEQFQVRWSMPGDQKMVLLNDDAYTPLVKIQDVTGIDLGQQPAHSVTTHPVTVRAFDGNTASMILPVPQCDRDYLAELGYNHDNTWVSLGQSRHTHVQCPVNVKAPVEPIDLEVRSPEEFQVRWTMPADQKMALLNDGAYSPQVKVKDVTGIDLAQQPVHSVTTHPVTDNDFDGNTASMMVPVERCDRDYLAELGYTHNGTWVSLGQSRHTHIACPPEPEPEVEDSPDINPLPLAGVGAGAMAATLLTHEPSPPVVPFSQGPTCYQGLTVNSQAHTYTLDEAKLSALQSRANRILLTPGCYILTFEQQPDPDQAVVVTEPCLTLWIYGGRFVNQKTNVETASTWTTLNGYNDSLTLDVIEPTTVCALFFGNMSIAENSQLTLLILKDE